MKSLNYVLIFALFSVSIFLISSSLSFDAHTGNKRFDEKLNDINKDALGDLKAFKTNISTYYLIDEEEVSNLMSFMEPAEILLTCELARLTEKSVTSIVSQYHKDKSLGWNKIFADLGIQKNSSQFKDLSQVELTDIYKQETAISKK